MLQEKYIFAENVLFQGILTISLIKIKKKKLEILTSAFLWSTPSSSSANCLNCTFIIASNGLLKENTHSDG